MQYAAGPPFYASTYTGAAFGDAVLYSVIPPNSVAILVIEGPIDIPLSSAKAHQPYCPLRIAPCQTGFRRCA